MPTFDGYADTMDWGLLVALAEGGEQPEKPEYVFGGGRREFVRPGQPWYDGYEEEPDE